MKKLLSFILLLTIVAVNASTPIVTPLGSLSARLRGPARVASDADGNIYVSEPAAGRVVVFNVFGQPVAAHEGFAAPLAIAVAGDGKIFLSEAKTGGVSVFDMQWNLLYQLGVGAGEFQLPGHLAVDPQLTDTVYVSDSRANLVRVYRSGIFVASFGGTGTNDGQFNGSAGIAVRDNGEVFVLDQNNDRVQVFTNGIFCRKFGLATGDSAPVGRFQSLALDEAGHLFVADTMQGGVKMYDAESGVSLGSLGKYGRATGQLNLPMGLILDRFGRLCVASANNGRIELFGVDNFLHLATSAPDGILAAGGSLMVSVVLGGTNSAGYQWRKDGTDIGGATNAVFIIPAAGLGDSGNYSVVINRPSGVIASTDTAVTVLSPPNILSDPVGRKLLAGQTASLVVLASGSKLNFQWQFNGIDLPGATNATLALPGVQVAQSGEYAVRVSNAVGARISERARLDVVAPPLVMDLVSCLAQPDRQVQVTLNADPGFTYELQASEDFVRWVTVTNLAVTGLADYLDQDAGNFPSRFYRLQWNP